MALKLFTFVYNTLLTQANDPSSKMFLPKVLSGMSSDGQPYLPLKVDQWQVDSLSGPGIQLLSANFATAWFTPYFNHIRKLKDQKPGGSVTQKMIDDAKKVYQAIVSQHLNVIPCPKANPSLAVKQLQIQGLANIKAKGNLPAVVEKDTGYQFTMSLNTNAYPASGTQWNRPLSLAGTKQAKDDNKPHPAFMGFAFCMSQCLCFSKAGGSGICVAKPDGVKAPPNPGDPDGFSTQFSGVSVISMTNALLAAKVTLHLSDDKKNLSLTLNQLVLEAESGDLPGLALEHLAIAATAETEIYVDVWSTYYKNLIQESQTAAAFNQKINAALADPENITKIQNTLNRQLANALDDVFGKPRAGFVFQPQPGNDSNEVDQYLFARMADGLSDPASKFYLPKLVLSNSSPVLEPYTTSEIDLPGPFSKEITGGVKIAISQIKFPKGLKITGFSNVIAPEKSITFNIDGAAAAFQIARLNPGPELSVNGHQKKVPDPPLTASASFSLLVQVAQNEPVGPITGNISISVKPAGHTGSPAVKTTLNARGTDVEKLVVTFSAIELKALPEEITIAIKLDGSGSGYSEFVSAVANQNDLKNAIIEALNQKISDVLPQISKAATEFVKKQIQNLG